MKKYFPMMLIIKMILIIGLFGSNVLNAQNSNSKKDLRSITFPDIEGYLTLKCDFHMHTVFSDGYVWPNIRVEEALKDDLDAISITEHLEYQPHLKDIPHLDRNRVYQLTQEYAKDNNLIIINGSELTRNMPPGHFNAIFIKDANKLLVDDPIEVLREAKRQGAFIFWNHPNWVAQKPDGVAELTEMHHQILNEGLMHGIEVVNDLSYSERAFQIAKDHNLTILGNSDVHGLVDWHYKLDEGGHRPISLVFAKERSKEGIKEALENRRTVAYFKNTLTGESHYLIPLIEASLYLKNIEAIETWAGTSQVYTLEIENRSSMNYILENSSQYGLYSHTSVIELKAKQSTVIQIKNKENLNSFDLTFKVLNAFIAPKVHPEIKIPITIEEPLNLSEKR